MSSQPYVVFGATGRTGLEAIRYLISRSLPVRAAIRDEKKAKERFSQFQDKQPECVKADLTDIESVKSAVRGAKAVICASGGLAPLGIFRRSEAPIKVDYEGIKNLVDALKEINPSAKLVLVSSIGVTRPNWYMTIILNIGAGNVMKWKLAGENYLRESGINYIIVRPGHLMDSMKKREGDWPLVFDQGDKLSGDVLRKDVGQVIVEAALASDLDKTTFEVVASEKRIGESCSEPSRDFTALFSHLKSDK